MWPKSRQPTATAYYHPIRDTEQQQQHDTQRNPPHSLWPTAPIPPDKLLGGANNNALKREHLLGGDSKINQSLLLSGGGGNKPIAGHLLLQPRFVEKIQTRGKEDREEEGNVEEEGDREVEHLDYLEATDEMPLTSRSGSGRGFRQGLRRISLRRAFVGATFVVVVICLVVGVGVLATGGKEHELGPGDYR